MTRTASLTAAAVLALGLLLGAADAQAGVYEIRHPLCDGSANCTSMTVWFVGAGENLDRIEAHIDGTCQVQLKDGSTTTASTETLSLSNGNATQDGISRKWHFPAGCNAWYHARHPRGWPAKDEIWSTTKPTTEDLVIKDPFKFIYGYIQ